MLRTSSMPRRTLLAFVALALVFASGLVACGSDSSTSSPSSAETPMAESRDTTSTTPDPPAEERSADARGRGNQAAASKPSVPAEEEFTPPPHQDSSGGSEQFRVKRGDNSIQEYGDEASSSDFVEAAAALHAYLDARAVGAWAAACTYLDRRLAAEMVKFASQQNGAKACPPALAAISSSAPPRVLREAARVDVAALRVKGDSAFLLFRDSAGQSLFISVTREAGTWKVAALAASPLGG